MARIGPDQADWYRSWSARDAVKVPLKGISTDLGLVLGQREMALEPERR